MVSVFESLNREEERVRAPGVGERVSGGSEFDEKASNWCRSASLRRE